MIGGFNYTKLYIVDGIKKAIFSCDFKPYYIDFPHKYNARNIHQQVYNPQ